MCIIKLSETQTIRKYALRLYTETKNTSLHRNDNQLNAQNTKCHSKETRKENMNKL